MFKIVWLHATPEDSHAQGEEERGTIAAAFEFARNLSSKAQFLMGQVLGEDGKVIANVAPGGTLKENR